jgi:hypothetical protein
MKLQKQEATMRRAVPFVLLTAAVLACQSDNPVGPTAPGLHERLTSPPDLSGLLPQLERRVFIHYRPGFAKPKDRGKPPKNGASECFSLLAKGASWTKPEPYRTTFPVPAGTWEFNDDIDIFGSGKLVSANNIEPFTGLMDGKNTAQFGPYDNSNVIAVTVVWGVFGGPPRNRSLVEWDLLMNDKYFTWGVGDPTKMDIENIAAHELGHAAGLGHPPNECTDETMYAFASAGEIKKRDLNAGDIAGILKLY